MEGISTDSFMLFFSALMSATLRRRWRFLSHWGSGDAGRGVGSGCLLGVGEGGAGEGVGRSEGLLGRDGQRCLGEAFLLECLRSFVLVCEGFVQAAL